MYNVKRNNKTIHKSNTYVGALLYESAAKIIAPCEQWEIKNTKRKKKEDNYEYLYDPRYFLFEEYGYGTTEKVK